MYFSMQVVIAITVYRPGWREVESSDGRNKGKRGEKRSDFYSSTRVC